MSNYEALPQAVRGQSFSFKNKSFIEIVLLSLCQVISWCPAKLLEGVAWIWAIFFFDILRLRRRIVLKNLVIAFGQEKTPKEMRRIGRKSYYNFVLTLFELLRSPHHDIAANVVMNGTEHVDQALAKGHGAYVICFHIGNWEAHSPAISRQVKPVHLVVKKVGSPAVNRFLESLRSHNGFNWIKRQQKGDAFAAMKKILAKNELVGFAFDQSRPGEPRLPFFSQTAMTNTSFAAIRQRMPAPVLTSFARRTRLGHHIVEFGPELKLNDGLDPANDIIKHSIQINQFIETVIRRYPEHYFWFHNRWK